MNKLNMFRSHVHFNIIIKYISYVKSLIVMIFFWLKKAKKGKF
jgi:hypothetical protein